MSALEYNSVQKNFFGSDALSLLSKEIKNKGYERMLIVTDECLYNNGTVAKVAAILETGGAKFGIFPKVEANPTILMVNECVEYAKSIGIDSLVAVGGGSAIDVTKAVGILLANGGSVEQYEGVGKSKNPSLPIIVVNTTAGTGSEVTNFYIITDEKRHTKLCMVDDHCLPTIAVNDSSLMRSMPPSLTAATGMDALTHCIESVLSRSANPLSNKDALWAISVISQYLPRVFANAEDTEAREYMAYAANIAGMAFSNSGLGIVHAMAHPLGGYYNLPHGMCNAILLPLAIEFNAGFEPKTHDRFRDIAATFGIKNAETLPIINVVRKLILMIQDLTAKLSIPSNLRTFGNVNPSDFSALAKLAMVDACMAENLYQPNLEQVEALYRRAY